MLMVLSFFASARIAESFRQETAPSESCAEEHALHIGLPRGCLEDLQEVLTDLNIRPVIRDERDVGSPLQVTFHGELRSEQKLAAYAMRKHDTGVLSATTAFGKTVVAAC
jgi:superfamily II DNA or RNA helicase